MAIEIEKITSTDLLTQWVHENAATDEVRALWEKSVDLITEWHREHDVTTQMKVSASQGAVRMGEQHAHCVVFTFMIYENGCDCFFIFNDAGQVYNIVVRPVGDVPKYERTQPNTPQ